MKRELTNALSQLVNERAHPGRPFDTPQLAKRLREMDLHISAGDLPEIMNLLFRRLVPSWGFLYVPPLLLDVLAKMLEGRSGGVICDPWAGIGTVLATIRQATQASTTIALTQNEREADFGRILVPEGEWKVGDPLHLLNNLSGEINVAASVLPFGKRYASHVFLPAPNGSAVELHGDLGDLILASLSVRLASDGLGLFVVTPAFFFSPQSVLRRFDPLGLGIVAALALPPGAFAPYANISTYLAVVRKGTSSRMFVAQLSGDRNTDFQIIENFKQGSEGATLELGRFVDAFSFPGIPFLRTAERLQQAERSFGYPAARLQELATAVTLGRPREGFAFPKEENAIFVPLLGISDVVNSLTDATLKPQNYAQVILDPARTNARFVAQFLNSELGREIRELNKSGVIPKLNRQSLAQLRVCIPDLQTQKSILAIEGHITAEKNVLLGLQNELSECRRELWSNPRSQDQITKRVDALAAKLSGDLKRQVSERLDQWFETLPFPLASILRAWQATPSDDFKTKYEHLLHFFEASAEFLGIILLSAFRSRKPIFVNLTEGLSEALKRQGLSFKRATFGTWKVVTEYLSKQVRQRMSKGEERPICVDMFADPSARLPEMLGRQEMAEIISSANKMRNDWAAHGGVVGQHTAQVRNEELLGLVQKFRDVTGDAWVGLTLISALHCRPRRGLFENEVALLKGSNSEFVKETRPMSTWLDTEKLYIVQKDAQVALELLPLIQFGPSPSSARNACYFFNRVEKDELHYVSYHFIDQPERNWPIKDAGEAGPLLEI